MLARNTSSRRRRASRSAASSPQRSQTRSSLKSSIASAAAATVAASSEIGECSPRSRRASIASGTGSGSVPILATNRSPRNSIAVPQGSETNLLSVSGRNARGSVSVSNGVDSLHPGKYSDFGGSRSARGSFADGLTDSLLMPTAPRSARASFSVPDVDKPTCALGSRSARGSFAIPEGSTDLLLPPQGTRSARGSFSCPNSEIQISVSGTRSARASFSVPSDNEECLLPMNRSPRGSFALPVERSPRGSLIPPEVAASCLSPRNSLVPDSSRSPRGSITQDSCRSPRGSIAPDHNKSPRGSIGPEMSRSPRGSLGPDGIPSRSPRTSLRGSLPDTCSLRGSNAAIGLQGSPRGSVDIPVTGSSKGALALTSSGSYRMATRGGVSNHANAESRRASSSVSQASADDRKHLCEHTKLNPEDRTGLRVYGSVVYQLKDANIEASGTCDFVLRALRIVFKTVTITIILVCLTALPIIMLIMGVNYLRDCPREPNLPVYMVVGGSFGTIKMLWVIWRQIRSRRYERLDLLTRPESNYEEALLRTSAGSRVTSFALTVFLTVWFFLGNYWTFHIYLPDPEPELYEPNHWCSRALYIFCLVHIGVIYLLVASVVVVAGVLSCCRVFSCSLVVRYK
ncbi:UNVERIFIED_CONTAM: hypothetical protein PYX00_004043 [Menopon gallinae]|uniref:Uncharacterized protein n=1 Tax=Menopon gallinae TaxID=328185 RepID=A0AAW2I333_9NEOP